MDILKVDGKINRAVDVEKKLSGLINATISKFFEDNYREDFDSSDMSPSQMKDLDILDKRAKNIGKNTEKAIQIFLDLFE